ncbi:hypothetical protein AKO1_003269 [Acrasis kona]|uniref:4 TM domain-containing transmembrane protein n=1 Tax=Acrasis kona TaxID=1008807 RepID=A0AAW2YLV5_9EUKA
MSKTQVQKAKLDKKIDNTKANINEAINIVNKEIKETKRYYRSILFATGSLLALNGLLLYFGTLSGSGRIDLARFYGFREGKNEHLQRSVGIMCFIAAIVNYFPLLFKSGEEKPLLWLAGIVDVAVLVHYSLETTVFKGLRLEIMICMGLFLLMNLGWTFKEVFQGRYGKKEVIVVKKTA